MIKDMKLPDILNIHSHLIILANPSKEIKNAIKHLEKLIEQGITTIKLNQPKA